ncbi:MAG: hypothetical protein QF662_01970, partial [Phycisphaerae bacterium]|nr:hypothetical protein [Phycisphaerae bacterium]
LTTLRSTSNSGERNDIAWALARISPDLVPDDAPPWVLGRVKKTTAVDKLIQAVSGQATARKIWAITALGDIGDARGENAIVNVLASKVGFIWLLLHYGLLNGTDHFHDRALDGLGFDGAWVEALAASEAAGTLGAKSAIPHLRRLAKMEGCPDSRQNWIVQLYAARALAVLKDDDPTALEVALEGFKFKRYWVILPDGWVMMKNAEDQESLPAEGASWRHLGTPNIHTMLAADTLGKIGGPVAKKVLKKRLELMLKAHARARDEYYCIDMLWIGAALKELGEEEDALRALRAGQSVMAAVPLDVAMRSLRLAGVHAIGRIGQMSSLPLIEEIMLHDGISYDPPKYGIREAARDAWERLKGIRPTDDPHRSFDLIGVF